VAGGTDAEDDDDEEEEAGAPLAVFTTKLSAS
jgi:hypothetical protein